MHESDTTRLRELVQHINEAYENQVTFNSHLREQIRRNLYYDPPPGITYGIHVRSVGTQTDCVRPKQNGAAVRPIKRDVNTNKSLS